ncbi:hypothetical protein [Curtobacterium sp. MCPF17_021]|uniref:hypothetical protein n=1 Tax=Curtobacterium sp. MCPF17_021 TaxID=2175639 RepID=UPI0011B57F39|nr:hypothetical protein [Curtobacterium sp. MCPF17_021]WIE82818.1 hypothetical protein DEJ29_015735 [Curtobacterium sp. MCPF17_021]
MPRWTEPLGTTFRRPPNLVPVRPGEVPPVLSFNDALERLHAQALTDFAVRREADGYISGSTREKPMTWDDVERSLHEKLESYRQTPRALVLQLGVEVQKPTPWWRHTGLGLDQFLDPTPGRSPVGKVVWSPAPEVLDDLVFGDLYLLPGQYPKWVAESIRNVRTAYGIRQAFSLAPDVPLRWASRLRIVQVTAALEQQRSDHIVRLQKKAEAEGESGYRAYDMWHNRHAQTVFMTPTLGRRVLRAGSVAELADLLVSSIPWLTDRDLTEQRLRSTLAVPVAPPAVRR